jgi:hypothetical protein
VNSKPDAVHVYVLLSSPHAVWPQLAVTGTSPGPVPLQLQPESLPASVPPSTEAQPELANVNVSFEQRYVLLSSPHADCPQAAVTGTPPGPVPMQLQPESAPESTPASEPAHPALANVNSSLEQRYVLLSSPQAVWPQFAVTGTPPGPVPVQLQHPEPENVNSSFEQIYVLLSIPHAVWPHAAVTGTPPGPVPVQLQPASAPESTPPSAQPALAKLKPEELQAYVFSSSPHADWPHAAVTGTPPGPVPVQLQPESVPASGAAQPAVSYSKPLSVQRYVFSSSPHAVSPQFAVTGTAPGPVPLQEQLVRILLSRSGDGAAALPLQFTVAIARARARPPTPN